MKLIIIMSNVVGYEEQKALKDKDLLTKDGAKPEHQVAAVEKVEEKQNASERINLQHIMELREKFIEADTS